MWFNARETKKNEAKSHFQKCHSHARVDTLHVIINVVYVSRNNITEHTKEWEMGTRKRKEILCDIQIDNNWGSMSDQYNYLWQYYIMHCEKGRIISSQ